MICVLDGAPAICLPPSKPRRPRSGDTLSLGSKWGHEDHKHAADTVPSTFHDELIYAPNCLVSISPPRLPTPPLGPRRPRPAVRPHTSHHPHAPQENLVLLFPE